MSQQSISEKSLQIRNETQEYANTRGRVADVLDDINETKANRTEVSEEIDEAIDALNIGSKMDRPVWDGSVKYYMVKSDAGSNNLQEVTLSANRVPVWSGNNLVDSPVYVSSGRVGIGAASVSEVLEVTGNVKANAVILPANGSSAIANRLRSDGTSVYYANGSSVERRISYFDEINSANVSSAINSATTAQKTSMRIALLGSATPPSPVINVVNTYFIKKETYTSLFLNGINLTPLDPCSIWIELPDTSKIFASSYYAISGTVLQTFWNIPSSVPTGEYSVKIANGGVVQGASPGKIFVGTSAEIQNIDLNSSNLIVKARTGFTINPNTTAVISNNIITVAKIATNYNIYNDGSLDSAIKTNNFSTPGSSWEIQINVNFLVTSAAIDPQLWTPFIFLTETNNSSFNSPMDLIVNRLILETSMQNNRIAISNFAIGGNQNFSLNIKKSGDIVNVYRIDPNNGTITLFTTFSIDDTKTYSLAFVSARNAINNQQPIRYQIEFTKFLFKA